MIENSIPGGIDDYRITFNHGESAGGAEMKAIVSWGGGTNSTAMIIEMIGRGLQIDYILFADTGSEMPDTYKFLDIFDEWLRHYDLKITVVKYKAQRGNCLGVETLEAECIKSKTLPSRAYGFGRCSHKWKITPQVKFLSQFKNEDVLNRYIGIDAGESHRADKIENHGNHEYHFPLIEWGIDRDGCKQIIKDAGLPNPGKSACFFCPSASKYEVLHLKEYWPELYQRAVAIEENADLNVIAGLGRRWAWKDIGPIDDSQESMFPPVPRCVMCWD